MKQLRNWISVVMLGWLGLLGLLAPTVAHAVTVAITTPTQNQQFNAMDNVAMTATVTGTGVTTVDFYQGTTKIGTKIGSPYNFTWLNVPAGTYSLTAQAKNFWGTVVATSAPVTITVTTSATAPTVSLTAPTANQGFIAGSSISLTANAASSNATISKVDFYQGSTLIGTATSAPYTVTWSNVAAGSYSLTAKATDSNNLATTSAAVPINVASLPAVWLINPSANDVYMAPASVTLKAGVLTYNSTITKVEFYQGSTLIGTVTTAPYTMTWSNVSAGNYSITAKATDNLGQVVTTGANVIIVNALPTVSLTAPTANQGFATGATITLNATAADSDGTISKVEFYQGSTLIGTATSAPYSMTWSNVAAGSYSLTAKATDNRSGVTTSSAVAITVATPPTVSLTSPTANQIVMAPGPVTLTANAASSGGTVSKVDFYQGSTLIGTATAAPYSISWNNIAPGSYSLTAVATDALGFATTSTAVAISVNAVPTISLISPSGAQAYNSGSTILLQATATDSDGTISKVDFYQGSTLIGTASSAPYSVNWSNVAVGTYSLTAVATDNQGATTTSAAVAITVSGLPKLYAIYTDHLNTPRLVTDENNTLVWRWLPTTEPFGNTPPEDDPNSTGNHFEFNLRFPGQYADKETGTFYNMMRDYDPATGRYVQSDPIGLAGGINTYAYVGGNPLSYIDPLGLDDVMLRIADRVAGIGGTPRPPLRPDGKPWGAGCGDAGTDCYVPDSLAGGNFFPSCRRHDDCYDTNGADRKSCDAKLGRDMKQACDIGKGGLACYVAAWFYPAAIEVNHQVQTKILGAPSPFDAAQKNAK